MLRRHGLVVLEEEALSAKTRISKYLLRISSDIGISTPALGRDSSMDMFSDVLTFNTEYI